MKKRIHFETASQFFPDENYRAALLDKVCKSDTLPSIPLVTANILALCKDPEVDFARVGEMAAADPALVAKLLRMANSPLFGNSHKILSVNAAVVRMGLKVTRMAVLGFGLEAEIDGKIPDSFEIDHFWRYSMMTATAARIIAETTCPEHRDECFAAGILQDIGIVAFEFAIPDEYGKVLAESRLHPTVEIHEIEKRLLGVTHMEVGSRLLREWSLPEEVYIPVSYHHSIQEAESQGLSPETTQITRILALAAAMSAFFHGRAKGFAHRLVVDMAWRKFRLPEKAVDEIFAKTEAGVRKAFHLFNVDASSVPSYPEVRAQAAQELARIASDLGRQVESAEGRAYQHEEQLHQLQLEVEELKELASHDDLTLLLNRREFLKRFDDEIIRCRRYGHNLSLILLDIDRFKSVNDKFGHAAGDQVLHNLGAYLCSETRASDMAARVGGEEFVILLPESEIDGLIAVAEKLRFGIAEGSKSWYPGLEGICVCAGAVHVRKDSPMLAAKAILQAADECLYKAKREGRNCTRYTTI